MAPPERPRRAPRPSSGRPSAPSSRSGGKPPAGRSAGRPGEGPKRPYKAREDGPKKSYGRRDDAERKPYQRRDDAERKPYQRRDDAERKPYRARRDDAERKPYQRRDDAGRRERRPFQRREEAPAPKPREERKGWGGVTRRGARQVLNPTPATDEAKAYERREGSQRQTERHEVDRWEQRQERPAPTKRPVAKKQAGSARPPRSKSLPSDVVAEVANASGNARRAPMLQKRLGDAARHMQHERYKEAADILRQMAQEVPEAASVRELYGQALYSLGRFKPAVAEFEAFIDLTQSTDQHPMLADSYRALGRHKKVAELWADLREASPSPDIVAEGRIVMAGSLADQRKLPEAIQLLEQGPPVRGRVSERHLRTWYALADLYERSGELSKSRALFQRILKADPEFYDVADRLRGLG